jgi:hypothetical protein
VTKLLLLPSARLIPEELQLDFGKIPSAMIPFDSHPAIYYICRPYREKGYALLVAAGEGADHILRYVASNRGLQIDAVDLGPTDSLGSTIWNSLNSLSCSPTYLVINLADTLVLDRIPDGDVVVCKKQQDVFRWTSFELDSERNLNNVVDKYQDKPIGRDSYVFVGVIGITDVPGFRQCLDTEIVAGPANLDSFYRAVVSYFNGIPPESKTFHEVEEWWDFGHADSYHAIRRSHFGSERQFNTLEIDSRRGLARKSSIHTSKLRDEIRWYLKLPKDLQFVAPRVFDYSLDVDSPYVEMEFYGYPSLNDIYLYGNCHPGAWSLILASIGDLLDAFGKYCCRCTSDDIRSTLQAMYIEKTTDRLRHLGKDERFGAFFQDELEINGLKCAGIPRVLDSLHSTIEAAGVYNCDEFHILHGDLCFSNILFHQATGMLRVIDPRGNFGGLELYGDTRYDLAKLSHCMLGDYDFLVSGLFDIEWVGGGLRLEPHLETHHQELKRLFERWLRERTGEDFWLIRIIESLLFLSMVPLHADRFRSQTAFLARGLECFTSAVAETARNIGGSR